MEEILDQDKSESHKEFQRLLADDLSKRGFQEGSIATGVVEAISKKFIYIDLNLKSSGAIPIAELEMTQEIKDISVGSKLEVLIEKIDTKDGEIIISREKARRAKTWNRMQKAYENNETVSGTIVSRVKGGFCVNIDSCICFLPGSQVDLRPLKNLDHLMNKKCDFLVVKLDKRRSNIVVSRRAIMEKDRDKDRDKIIKNIKVGDVVTGLAKNITSWGVFIDLNGVDALMHITDLSWSRVNQPGDLIQVGQQVRCLVTKIDSQTKKISVSIKHLTEDPYEKQIHKYEIGKKYKAVVSKIMPYGVFCKLEDGLEGLIHQSELSYLNKNISPEKVLSTTQSIEVIVLSKDLESRRLSLSLRATQVNPWEKFIKEHKVGNQYEGTVKAITDYGLFIKIKDTDLDGMVHYKDLSWQEKESELERYKKNQVVKFTILEIKKDEEKIRLGIKQNTESPYKFFENKKVNDIITVNVISTAKNGIYVGVDKKNYPFFIKKDELAAEAENQRISRFSKGMKCDCMIASLDLSKNDRNKVVLSIKKMELQEAKETIKKYGSKDSGGILKDIFDFSKIKTKDKKSKK